MEATAERTLREVMENQRETLLDEMRRHNEELQAAIAKIGMKPKEKEKPAWSR